MHQTCALQGRVVRDESHTSVGGEQVVGHLGGEPPRADRVDPHTLAGPLQPEFSGEIDESGFGRRIAGLLAGCGADHAEHGGDVDD